MRDLRAVVTVIVALVLLATVTLLFVSRDGDVMATVSPLQSPLTEGTLQEELLPFYPDAYPWEIVRCPDPTIEAIGGLCVGPYAVPWYP